MPKKKSLSKGLITCLEETKNALPIGDMGAGSNAALPVETPLGTVWVFNDRDLEHLIYSTFGEDMRAFFRFLIDSHLQKAEELEKEKIYVAERDALVRQEEHYQRVIKDNLDDFDEVLNYLSSTKHINKSKVIDNLNNIRNNLYSEYL